MTSKLGRIVEVERMGAGEVDGFSPMHGAHTCTCAQTTGGRAGVSAGGAGVPGVREIGLGERLKQGRPRLLFFRHNRTVKR
jgi:hypothetical protein